MFSLKDKLNNFVKKLRKTWKISQKTYDDLRISSCKPGVLYGLPKTHKENTPMRPILSAISTFNYKLAKFLCPILKPIVQWRQKETPHPVRLNYPKISNFLNINDIAKKLGKHMNWAMSYMSR